MKTCRACWRPWPGSIPGPATWGSLEAPHQERGNPREEIVSQVTEQEGRPARLITATDVTDRRRAERGLADAKERLSDAQRVARLGSWEWDPNTGQMRGSSELQRMLRMPADAAPSFESWRPLLEPRDRPRLDAALGQVLREGAASSSFASSFPAAS